jgi:hypothetical protein
MQAARAMIALRKNDPASAIEGLRPAMRLEPGPPTMLTIYVRGLAHLQAKSGAAAATEFQKIIDRPGVSPLNIVHPLAHLSIARAYIMMGDGARARKAYEDFLTLWKDADPDIPVFIQAKQELAAIRP